MYGGGSDEPFATFLPTRGRSSVRTSFEDGASKTSTAERVPGRREIFPGFRQKVRDRRRQKAEEGCGELWLSFVCTQPILTMALHFPSILPQIDEPVASVHQRRPPGRSAIK